MSALLDVRDLRKTFGGGQTLFGAPRPEVRAVDGISFTLARGETLGLVGETGSGKSTLGRLVLRLIEPSAGQVRFEDTDVTAASTRALRAMRPRMQMVFQDPYGSIDPRMTAGAIIAEPMTAHGVGRAEAAGRAARLLAQVGLSPAMAARYPHEFSGGQRQRIGIARAIALDPSLVVLDEPVSALDVSVQAQILNLLAEIQARSGVAFLFIAHDLGVVRHVSDRVAVMYLGRVVEMAPRDALYGAPLHPYTVSLLAAVPRPDPLKERNRPRIRPIGEIGSAASLPTGCRFHPRCPRARLVAARGGDTVEAEGTRLPSACVRQDPLLAPAGGAAHLAACHFPHED
ncbi:ABC transporter ATP-binding protein [Roseococcus suduntuyensis]|uniref:Oligopeptide transport system ATP-binding protein n=1 Tax=Roseococcus suduntuyensis TaxID=455361 RepID=A0A840A773_9PROT|nr:ABC transporter ATP-binding protein [Roseococcus suduntuyensis]MBB3896722.1 oligopeptide transport system ATP-binding protein [Roseococcus suduntuyensis]